MPALRSPPVISVMCPSLIPGVTATATGVPSSGRTQTCLAAAVLALGVWAAEGKIPIANLRW